MAERTPTYYCDPNKNLNCKQNGTSICGNICTKTSKIEFAVIGTNGKPILYKEEDRIANMALNERKADI